MDNNDRQPFLYDLQHRYIFHCYNIYSASLQVIGTHAPNVVLVNPKISKHLATGVSCRYIIKWKINVELFFYLRICLEVQDNKTKLKGRKIMTII